MPHNLPLSGDPRAAAEQALHLAADVSGPVRLSFTGVLDDVFDGVHHQGLTVTVDPGTSVDKVVADLREEAQNPRR
ncbi:hypothetical protein [Actinomadura mexicana]|uniref:Uncharacterized protein n=1 Tax=Actinomadura mexicana TaxID=134959 RepID=A0A239CKL3_9ACTN|nr:hypothetical protein [Actinomadura mexicana]SNS20211.1 hypothetical protein SAMN06265355_112244 [Actinomadura mexicana]